MIRIIISVISLSILHGAAYGEEAKPHDGKVYVNIYRYKQAMGMGIRPSLFCDDKDIARLQSGRYVVLALEPGKHIFRSNDAQSRIEIDLKRDQIYYIRLDIAPGVLKGHGRLNLMLPEQGKPELEQLKPIDKDMVKDPTSLAVDFKPLP